MELIRVLGNDAVHNSTENSTTCYSEFDAFSAGFAVLSIVELTLAILKSDTNKGEATAAAVRQTRVLKLTFFSINPFLLLATD